MKNYLSNLESKLLRIIREIGREAGRRKVSAYVVGGIVRDILLKNKNLDLDIVVEGDAIRLAKVLARKWNARVTLYRQFGTASLKMPGELRIDLATARKECYMRSGTLPIVRAGVLKEDLFRRDFTINAMAIAINPDCFGRLIDEFGGLKDLSKKKIRVLHERSFIDDPTRILRAVRFEQRFHFQMERQTLFLLKTALQKKVVENVKPPRYFAEFKKVLCEADPVRPLKRLRCLGGLQFFDARLKICFQNLSRMHKQIQKTKQKAIYKKWNDWWIVYFMGLIAKADDRILENILRKFHFTRNEKKNIQQSRGIEGIIRCLSSQNLLSSQVYRKLKPLTIGVVLYLRVGTSRANVCRRIDRFLREDINVQLQISGEDLKRKGVACGRQMGRALEDVLYLKIDKRVSTKKEELDAAVLSLGRY